MAKRTDGHAEKKKRLGVHAVVYVSLIVAIGFLIVNIVRATTPNPGHPWTDVGDGTFAITGPTAFHTYTVPDATTTILTDLNDVTLAQGGTGATLTASNGGIFYSTGSAGAILSGTSTAGRILQSGASAAPTWSVPTYPSASQTAGKVLISDGTNFVASTPTYPNASATGRKILVSDGTNFIASTETWAVPGTSGNILTSDGTNWTSAAPDTMVTVVTRPYLATGAIAAGTNFTTVLTTGQVGLFPVPSKITINQLSYNVTVAGTSPSYTLKICVYSEAGTKLLDVTSAAITTSGVKSTTVSPSVTLSPGNYYILVGLATQSGTSPTINFSDFTSTAATWVNTSAVPAGKKVYEGTVTKASGVCDASLATITGVISSTPVVRLDN